MHVVTATVDEHLNDQAFIVPGLGDAGDRQFGPPAYARFCQSGSVPIEPSPDGIRLRRSAEEVGEGVEVRGRVGVDASP